MGKFSFLTFFLQYSSNLGMKMEYQFHDVLGLDSGLLAMVPQSCIALLLLFPINDKVNLHINECIGILVECVLHKSYSVRTDSSFILTNVQVIQVACEILCEVNICIK